MYARFVTLTIALALALTAAPVTHAQTTNLADMLTRMQSIMSEMEKLQQEFKTLAAQVGTGTVLGAQTSTPQSSGSSVFTLSLDYGETNDDIKRIQRLLATDPAIYPYGVASGFFGPKTEEAIKNLQSRFGLNPVGAIGPATTALLSGYMQAYPNENYPDGVLSSKPPTVLGASTSGSTSQLSALQQQLQSLTGGNGDTTSSGNTNNPLKAVYVEVGSNETWVDVVYTSGKKDSFGIDADDEDEIIAEIAEEIDESEAHVEAVIDIEGRSRRSSSDDADEDDAEDALADAEDAIDEAEDEIDEADEDGDDIDWAEDTLDEAKDLLDDADEAFDDEDWDEVVDLADEATELAEDAIDRIDEEEDDDDDDDDDNGDSDEVESIEVEVLGDDEAEVTVEYENGDDESFDVDEDRKEDIITEVADELDMDEDDVEDVIEFDYGDIDEIAVYYETGRIRVEVEFESGVSLRLLLDEDLDEDEVIEEVADELDVDEEDVEDVIDF